MIHLTDEQIDTLIDYRSALPVLEDGFLAVARGQAATQARVRTEAGGVKLSTLGAVLPEAGYAGAKVYTTLNGQFNFVIVLFSAADGQPLATLAAQAITRVRTAATTVLAARALARREAKVCAVLGTGVQGSAHALAFAELGEVAEVRIAGLGADELAQHLDAGRPRGGARIVAATTEAALAGADIVVTATRAATPLFDGQRIEPGAFVAAIGSSLPHTRELDDTILRRAASIVVEWREQARAEAGDLILAGDALDWNEVLELPQVLRNPSLARRSREDIVVYKAVGIGLQDVALAGLAWRRWLARQPA